MRIALIALAAIIAFGVAIQTPTFATSSPCPPTVEQLRILNNPDRYEIHHGCLSITGTVVWGQLMEEDGEFHTYISVDRGWRSTFAPGYPGDVVVDTELHTNGDLNSLPIFWPGQRVRITGAFVYDRLRGYGRINPVSFIEGL